MCLKPNRTKFCNLDFGALSCHCNSFWRNINETWASRKICRDWSNLANNNGDEINRYFLPNQEVFVSIFHIFLLKLMLCDLRAEESCRFFFLACCLAIYCVIQNCFSCLIRIIILKISSNKWLVSPELRFFYSWVFSFKKMTTVDATVDFCVFLVIKCKHIN